MASRFRTVDAAARIGQDVLNAGMTSAVQRHEKPPPPCRAGSAPADPLFCPHRSFKTLCCIALDSAPLERGLTGDRALFDANTRLGAATPCRCAGLRGPGVARRGMAQLARTEGAIWNRARPCSTRWSCPACSTRFEPKLPLRRRSTAALKRQARNRTANSRLAERAPAREEARDLIAEQYAATAGDRLLTICGADCRVPALMLRRRAAIDRLVSTGAGMRRQRPQRTRGPLRADSIAGRYQYEPERRLVLALSRSSTLNDPAFPVLHRRRAANSTRDSAWRYRKKNPRWFTPARFAFRSVARLL
jgi:hypothetical protein